MENNQQAAECPSFSKKKTICLLIIDESGSMQSIQNETINTYKTIVQKIYDNRMEFEDLEQYIALWTFNRNITEVIPPTLVSSSNFPEFKYNPNGFTPLYDAIGISTRELEVFLHKNSKIGDYLVNVNIITDGLENSSKEYTQNEISMLIERLETQNWKFEYFGADHNVERASRGINIKRHQTFTKDAEGMNHVAYSAYIRRTDSLKEWLLFDEQENQIKNNSWIESENNSWIESENMAEIDKKKSIQQILKGSKHWSNIFK